MNKFTLKLLIIHEEDKTNNDIMISQHVLKNNKNRDRELKYKQNEKGGGFYINVV